MAESKKSSVKSKVEAILFSVGHKISLDDISRLSRSRKEEVLVSLKELQAEYEQKQSSLMLVDEGDFWKFTVRDHLMSVVRKIVTETELTKSVMETLAVIAFKYPILQSDLIKLRTNKAYDHLVELEKSGYITRQKHSRTNLIKLTEKFFRYFDLTEEKLREQFKDFESIARAIKEKETEVEQIKEQQKKSAEDLKQQDEKIKKEIESLNKVDEEFEIPLETYEAKQESATTSNEPKPMEEDTMDNLEVVDVPQEEKPKEISKITEQETEIPAPEENIPDNPKEKPATPEYDAKPALSPVPVDRQPASKNIEPKKPKKHKGGIKVTPEMEKKVDERVQEIISGKDGNDENTVQESSNAQ